MKRTTKLISFLLFLFIFSLPKLLRAQTIPPSPLSPIPLFVNPYSQARAQANSLPRTNVYYNSAKYVADRTTGYWVTDWNSVFASNRGIARYVQTASTSGGLPTIVIYGIPGRDCNQSSAGGMPTAKLYQDWIQEIANQIGTKPAIIILEPDAIGLISTCQRRVSGFKVDERISLLRDAVWRLGTYPGRRSYLYLDVSFWSIQDRSAFPYLRQIFTTSAISNLVRGYALNVSNYRPTTEMQQRCNELNAQPGLAKPCVIDTSRNGVYLVNNGAYCNRVGAGLGVTPTTRPNLARIDAFLWIKNPGESDGNEPGVCAGGNPPPPAGTFALHLAKALFDNSPYRIR